MKTWKSVKRLPAILGIALLLLTMLPLAVFAAETKTPPPEEPYQRVVYTQGNWHSEYTKSDGKTYLIVSYEGNREIEQITDSEPIKFSLSSKTLLKGVYLPYTYPGVNPQMEIVSFWLTDQQGNVYGPFNTIPVKTWAPASPGTEVENIYVTNAFVAEQEIILPAGEYSLYATDNARLVRNSETGSGGAVLIKGTDYTAWKKYKEKLLQWEIDNNPAIAQDAGEPKAELTVVGSAELAKARETSEKYQGPGKTAVKPKPATISLKEPTLLDEIVFNTYNSGNGAKPGLITITDQKGSVQGQYQAYGGMLGGKPNGIWIAAPGIVLPKGEYVLTLSDMSVVTYDEKGYPDFYVTTAPMPPKQFDFTGTYGIDLDVIKTSNIFGPVEAGVSSFSLRDFELTVLDKGETIEVIGNYEGMPFSQVCEVVERTENSLQASYSFNMDLSNLPYQAQIGSSGTVVLQKPPGLQAKIQIPGTATFQRAATKDKGADFNTYKVVGGGSMTSNDLPAYVLAALGASIPSVGNIPGPDTPWQAAAGALFPPLAGVVAHVVQTLLNKPKQQPRDKAWYKSKYPGKTDEEIAMIMLADAMGNSDEPDDDPLSVGDNEMPGGSDYGTSGGSSSGYAGEGYAGDEMETGSSDGGSEDEGSTGEGSDGERSYEESSADGTAREGDNETGEGSPAGLDPAGESGAKMFGSERERLEAERDEWLENLKISQGSADPNDPRSKELHEEYRQYIDSLNGKIDDLKHAEAAANMVTRTVQIDHTGRTLEIAYDPQTDRWHSTETGAEFNMEIYTKDTDFAKHQAFNDANRTKLENRDTAFDRAMDALVADQKERTRLLGQLQNMRNQSYGITPPAEGVGDVPANIDKLINDLSNRDMGTDQLRERASRIAKVVTDRNTGRTMDEDAAKQYIDREMSYTKATAVTITEGATDVITGRTWAGMAGRAGLAALTGGASEYVLSPAEALMDIKESMDSGETGMRATLKAMGKYALGELGGEYVGEAWKRSGYSVNPDFLKKAADLGNTPVSKLLGSGAKAGTEEALEGAASNIGKRVLGSADNNLGKTASDLAEYSKYRTGVNNQASVIDSKIRAGEPLSTDDLRKVLRDPSVPRELKNSHLDVQNQYQDTLEKTLYTPANTKTSAQLEKNLLEDVQKEFGPGAKIKVEVESVRTPGGKGSRINADNDLTGKITITDANGKTITREIPAEKVAPVYNEKFAEQAGMMKNGEFDVAKAKAEMPEGITITDAQGKTQTIDWDQATNEQQLEAFAKKHNQEITDIHAAEAAVDFNAAKNASGVSNVGQLKAGVSSAQLADPGGLAKMEQYKIDNYFNKGGIANQTEGYEQLAKMGKLTNDLTNAYQKLGYNAADMPANMQKALDISSNRRLSPGTRTLELQKLGFDGPEDLANKLSGRIEGLQKLGQPKAGQPADLTLEKFSSIIIGSYLNDKDK